MSRQRNIASAGLAGAAPIFAALGDETRLRLVARLCTEGPLSIVHLSARGPRHASGCHEARSCARRCGPRAQQASRAPASTHLGARAAAPPRGTPIPGSNLGAVGRCPRALASVPRGVSDARQEGGRVTESFSPRASSARRGYCCRTLDPSREPPHAEIGRPGGGLGTAATPGAAEAGRTSGTASPCRGTRSSRRCDPPPRRAR